MPEPPEPGENRAPVDVLAVGRVGVDLYARESHVSLEAVQSFAKSLGGTAANVCVGGARLGRRTALVSKVGNDAFGRYLRGALEGFGVDTSFVGVHPSLATPLAFCALDPPADPELVFYRTPQAPDSQLIPEDLDPDALDRSALLWVTGGALSVEPSRSAALAWMQQRRAIGKETILDLDYRPSFWRSATEARALYQQAIPLASVVVGNEHEVLVAVAAGSPWSAGERILKLGSRLAVVKLGESGAIAIGSDETVCSPGLPVPVTCGLGSGDAFGAVVCHGILDGWPLDSLLSRACAAGGIVASRLACADAMPTLEEIEHAVAGRPPDDVTALTKGPTCRA